MRGALFSIALVAATAAAVRPASAEQVLLRLQSWAVAAPDRADCSKPLVLRVSGDGNLFDPSNRAYLQAVALGIAPGVAKLCPSAREVVLDDGRTRRVIPVGAAGGATPSAASASTPAPAAPIASPPPPASVAAERPAPAMPAPAERAAIVAAPRRDAPARSDVTLKPIAAYPDRQLESIEKAKGTDGKCEALLTWLNRMIDEYPQMLQARRLPPTAGLALYRDPDFSQAFGRSFEQTTTKWRAEMHEKVIAKCQGLSQNAWSWRNPTAGRTRQPAMTTYAAQLEIFKPVLDGPFLSLGGAFSPQAVSAAVAATRTGREWMDAAIREAGALPPVMPSLEAVDRKLAEGRTQLSALWPSEQQYFTKALADRRVEVAGAVTQTWIAEIAGYGSTLADARRLREQRDRVRPALTASSDAQRVAEQSAFTAKLDAILGPALDGRVAELSKIPSTLSGGRALLDWKRSVDDEVRGFDDRPAAASMRSAYAAARRRVLEGALPEWRGQFDGSAPPTADRLAAAATTLAELFPADARNEPAYRDYDRTLADQTERRRQVEYAAAVKPCDTTAAHPDDPEAVAPGVSDERLDHAKVITACGAAVKAAGADPRLAFQLARGYLKAQRFEEAIEQLLPGARQGHGASLAYLAELHLEGVPGIDADPALAYSLFERAVEGGFKPAAERLKEFEDYSALAEEIEAADAPAEDARAYNAPHIVDNIVAGNLDAVPSGEVYTKIYLVNMIDTIVEECPAQLPAAEMTALKSATFSSAVDLSAAGIQGQLITLFEFMRGMTENMAGTIVRHGAVQEDLDALPIKALQDAFVLKSRSDCGTPEMAGFVRNAKAFITDVGAPRMPNDRLLSVCSYNAKPAGRFGTRSFCECFVAAASNVAKSRSQRKRLTESEGWWATAQEVMANDPSQFRLCSSTPGGRIP